MKVCNSLGWHDIIDNKEVLFDIYNVEPLVRPAGPD